MIQRHDYKTIRKRRRNIKLKDDKNRGVKESEKERERGKERLQRNREERNPGWRCRFYPASGATANSAAKTLAVKKP